MTTQPVFPFQATVEVSFRDLDVLGHVNNAVYLTYLETARIKFLHEVLDLQAVGQLPLILAEATVSYRAPAFFGELLTVGVGVARFGGKSFEMRYRIDGGDGRLVAEARTVLVAYDYTAGATIPVPEELKARVLAFQRGWQFAG